MRNCSICVNILISKFVVLTATKMAADKNANTLFHIQPHEGAIILVMCNK